ARPKRETGKRGQSAKAASAKPASAAPASAVPTSAAKARKKRRPSLFLDYIWNYLLLSMISCTLAFIFTIVVSRSCDPRISNSYSSFKALYTSAWYVTGGMILPDFEWDSE